MPSKLWCLIGVLAMLGPASALADTPGRHLAYLHARTDLRVAQLLLRVKEQKGVQHHLRDADGEVESVIHEIDEAAILDPKDIDDHPSVDSSLERTARFSRIVGCLRSAREDLEHADDAASATALRTVAIRHINEALESVRKAAVDLQIDRSLDF